MLTLHTQTYRSDNKMSLQKAQDQVDAWVQQFNPPYWKPLEQLARLTEEVGELARELNDRYGAKKKKSSEDQADLEEELGDILFTLICLANSHNIKLDKSFSTIMDKCYGRDNDRFTKK